MRLKKIAVTAAMTGALGLTALGFGAGTAQADDCVVDIPFVPDVCGPGPDLLPPPGHIGQLTGVPPGHWNDFVPFFDIPGLPGIINQI